MRNAVVVGNSLQILGPVMLAIRSFSHAKINVIGNDSTRSIRWSLLCDQWTRHSLSADEDLELLNILQSLCTRDRPARIIAVDCEAARALNRLRPLLPAPLAPMPSSDHLTMLEDKWQFHRLCQRKGLPTPLTLRFENKQALRYEVLTSALGTTFVIKPSNLAGSQGVRIIRSKAMFESEILRSKDYQFSRKWRGNDNRYSASSRFRSAFYSTATNGGNGERHLHGLGLRRCDAYRCQNRPPHRPHLAD